MPEFPDPTIFAAPAFVLLVALEWWCVRTGKVCGRYQTKDALTSILMGLGSAVVNTLTAAIALFMLMLFWPYRILEIPINGWSFILVFVLYDFTYYWKHRLAHRVRWFWAEHITHHSSQHYNLSTALRQPWVGPFIGGFLIGAPMVLLGFHPAFIGLAAGFNLIYQFWIHTEAINRLPRWYEAVMNTPSHHRVHHATNPRYLDSNYAGVFIIWDRMFGTYMPEMETDKPDYGLVHNLTTHNPIVVAYHGVAGFFRDCWHDGLRPWRWLARMVMPPGWSPDGNHDTSTEIKRAYMAAHPDQVGTPGLPQKLAG